MKKARSLHVIIRFIAISPISRQGVFADLFSGNGCLLRLDSALSLSKQLIDVAEQALRQEDMCALLYH